MTASEILQAAQELAPKLSEMRQYLHRHPGIGFEVQETVDYVEEVLRQFDIKASPCGQAGLAVLIGGQKPGKTFLLRADMDALEVREESGEPFAAQNGKMHACGHDMHTAMLLGAAILLKERESTLKGTVKLMFQPAEELLLGAADMVESGVLKDPEVDGAMMLHVTTGTSLPTGSVVVCESGVSAPAADMFAVCVRGKGCHGSTPHIGVDPLQTAAHILLALQELPARELAMSDRAAVTVGAIHAGDAPNIIPDTTELYGSLRAYDEDLREMLKERVAQISKSIAEAFRAQAEVEFTGGCPGLLNDESLSAAVSGYLTELLGEESVMLSDRIQAKKDRFAKVSGSEDFAYVSQKVPSLMVALGAGNIDEGYKLPLHNPGVRFDEASLPIGSAVYAWSAIRWLEEQ